MFRTIWTLSIHVDDCLPALHAEQPAAGSYANSARCEVGCLGNARRRPVSRHRQRVQLP